MAGDISDAPDAATDELYVGWPARLRPSGRRDAVADGAMIWANCDDAASVMTLARFEVPPSLVVATAPPTTVTLELVQMPCGRPDERARGCSRDW